MLPHELPDMAKGAFSRSRLLLRLVACQGLSRGERQYTVDAHGEFVPCHQPSEDPA